jgi:hypothetical protein
MQVKEREASGASALDSAASFSLRVVTWMPFALRLHPFGNLDVTLHSNAGKCAFGSRYCTQIPEFAEPLYSNPGQKAMNAKRIVSSLYLYPGQTLTRTSSGFYVQESGNSVQRDTKPGWRRPRSTRAVFSVHFQSRARSWEMNWETGPYGR